MTDKLHEIFTPQDPAVQGSETLHYLEEFFCIWIVGLPGVLGHGTGVFSNVAVESSKRPAYFG